MRPFTIMVDSNCDLSGEYIKEHDIRILQMPFTYNGKEYPTGDWTDLSYKDYYGGMRNGGTAGTTLINPETFVRVFTEYAERDEDFLVITLSGGLSTTYQNSQIALAEVREKYPDANIHAVDSIIAAGGCGLLVMLAVKQRAEGLGAAETAACIEERKHCHYGLYMVDDLMYLHRGGRISKLQAVAGSLIGIKPVLSLTPDGKLIIRGKGRKHKGAMELIVRQMKEIIAPSVALDSVIICHTDCQDEAESFATMVQEAVSVGHLQILVMNPIIGGHVGPGCLALFFESAMTRVESDAKLYPDG